MVQKAGLPVVQLRLAAEPFSAAGSLKAGSLSDHSTHDLELCARAGAQREGPTRDSTFSFMVRDAKCSNLSFNLEGTSW